MKKLLAERLWWHTVIVIDVCRLHHHRFPIFVRPKLMKLDPYRNHCVALATEGNGKLKRKWRKSNFICWVIGLTCWSNLSRWCVMDRPVWSYRKFRLWHLENWLFRHDELRFVPESLWRNSLGWTTSNIICVRSLKFCVQTKCSILLSIQTISQRERNWETGLSHSHFIYLNK